MTYTPTLGAFAKPVSRLALGSFAGAFVRAYDPRSEIMDFGQELLRVTDDRVGDAIRSPLFESMLDVVGPIRVYGIVRNLRDAVVDGEALRAFLEHTWEAATTRLATTDSPDAAAEVLADALDDLHVYVLSHELVDARSYLEVEQAIAERLGEPDHDPQPQHDEPRQHPAPAAAENNLALAA